MKYIIFLIPVFAFLSCNKPPELIISERDVLEDIDGNKYKTIKIGNQWWMAENLRVRRYQNGDSLYDQIVTNFFRGDSVGSYTSHKPEDDFIKHFGLLYNWFAVNDERGLCPAGWHVPTDYDWNVLERNVLNIKKNELDLIGWRGSGAGRLKDTDTLSWRSPNVGANNKSEFSARAAGFASGASYENLYNIAYHWTSSVFYSYGDESEYLHITALTRELNFYNDRISRTYKYAENAMSVRCLKSD